MKLLNSILKITALSLVALTQVNLAQADARSTVENTVDQVQKVVRGAKPDAPPEKIDQDLRKVIAPIFDFDEMSKRCLGGNWKNASPDEQKTFTELFSELLAKNYLKQIRLTAATADYVVLHANEENGKAVVQTKVDNDKGTLKVDYRLYQRDNVWRVYDVIIENIGLVSNYRSEFTEIISDSKMSGLIEKLRLKIKHNADAEKK